MLGNYTKMKDNITDALDDLNKISSLKKLQETSGTKLDGIKFLNWFLSYLSKTHEFVLGSKIVPLPHLECVSVGWVFSLVEDFGSVISSEGDLSKTSENNP